MRSIIAGKSGSEKSFYHLCFKTLLVLLLIGFAAHPVKAKTVPSQVQNESGHIVWHDLFTHDLESTCVFYKELFGWSFVDSSSGNTHVKHIFSGEENIGNIIEIKPPAMNVSEAQWLSYISVDNAENAVKLIQYNGGTVRVPVRKLSQKGHIAICLDPQQAVFGILQSTIDKPAPETAELNTWIGSELWTNDTDNAEMFYGNLVGYQTRNITLDSGETFQALTNGEEIMASMVKIPFDDVQPNWVPYIAVQDTVAITERILQLGGQLLTEVDREHPENAAVIVADPTGGVFGIQQVVLDSNTGEAK